MLTDFTCLSVVVHMDPGIPLKGNSEYTNYLKAPRMAKIPAFLKTLPFHLDVKLDSIDVEKGWWWETTYFTFTGTPDNLTKVHQAILDGIEDYKNR